ncbi:MAG: hypothetical protein ABW036_13645 [Flavitalea sp.]
MKTYQSPGSVNSTVSIIRKNFFLLAAILISSAASSQELAIVKSPYNPVSQASLSETVKGTEGGAANYMSVSKVNANGKVATEKNMEIFENTFNVCLDNRKAVINWMSFQDLNTNFYIIERSVGGAPFKEVAQVFTSPDSTSKFEYQYFDKLGAEIKGAIYYRLKIIGADEMPVYTPIQLASSNKTYENLLVSIKS